MKVQDLKQGDVLAETAFYTFQSFDKASGLALLKNDNGVEVSELYAYWNIPENYQP